MQTRPEFEIRSCTKDEPGWEDAYSIRVKVFVDEQGFTLDEEIDHYDSDPTTLSFVLILAGAGADASQPVGAPVGTPIGTIRYTRSADKLSRLAVLPAYRKYGFGRELVRALEAHAARAGGRRIVVHSQIPVVAFYARLGYEPEGERFDEDGEPHQRMIKRIAG